MTGLDRPLEPLTALRGFRERLHGAMRRRQDALFDLTDAILTAGAVPSPIHLSLVPSSRQTFALSHTPFFLQISRKTESQRADSADFQLITSETFLLDGQPCPHYLGVAPVYRTVTKVKVGAISAGALPNTSG